MRVTSHASPSREIFSFSARTRGCFDAATARRRASRRAAQRAVARHSAARDATPRMAPAAWTRVAIVALAVTLSTRAAVGLEIRVRRGETECVTERVREADVAITGSWFVTKGSNTAAPSERGPPGYGTYDDYYYWDAHEDAFDARATLERAKDGSEEEIYNALKRSEHRFDYVARDAGTLRTCFTNSGSRDASVSYSASLGHRWDHEKAKAQHIDPTYERLNNVESSVGTLMEEVKYHERRAKRHLRTAKSTDARVVRWALCEAAVMILASYYQFYCVKKLFQTRDRRGGFARV